jgi:hypothetical protein
MAVCTLRRETAHAKVLSELRPQPIRFRGHRPIDHLSVSVAIIFSLMTDGADDGCVLVHDL